MIPALIGLSGKKRSGKDTVGQWFVNNHGFTRAAYADPMREALLALDPLIWHDGNTTVRLSEWVRYHGWEHAKQDPEVRRLLQRFGTDMGRLHFGANFWVDLLWDRLDRFAGPLVITDVRFVNEAATIRARGGYLLRIERPADHPAAISRVTDPHPSETALDNYSFDATIVNSGTVEELHRALAELFTP